MIDCASCASRFNRITAGSSGQHGPGWSTSSTHHLDVQINGAWTMNAGRDFPRLKRLVVSRGVWGVVLSGVLVSGSCWLSAADEAPATGLRGILPASTPSDLPITISALPDNWKEWGVAFTAELATLYETE